jgi:hypothetical protein
MTKPIWIQAACPKDKVQKYNKMQETLSNTQYTINDSSSQRVAKVTTSENYDRQGGISRTRLQLAVNEKYYVKYKF